MKRSTADFLLEFSPVIIAVIGLVERLWTGVAGYGAQKHHTAMSRLSVDPRLPLELHVVDLVDAIDRAVLWNNTFGWRDDFDTQFEDRGDR